MLNFALRRLPLCARRGARRIPSGRRPLSHFPAYFSALVPALAPAFIASPAHADSAPADATLPAVSVTASANSVATPRAVDPNLPASVETVTREQFDNWNVVNTEVVLKYMPNLAVRKRFIGDLNSIIAVRGTSNTQSARGLVYADGMLLSNLLGNSYSFPPEWSMVSPDGIQQVSVIYGPFSAAYPGNSLGATVLITTRMPTHF